MLRRFVVPVGMLALSGCCTIFNGPDQTLYLDSSVPQTQYTVRDKDDHQIAAGVAPAKIKLKGYKAPYTLDFQDPQGQQREYKVEQGVTKWFFGNLVIGGLIGFGIDAATGSLYILRPDHVDIDMADGSNLALAAVKPPLKESKAESAK